MVSTTTAPLTTGTKVALKGIPKIAARRMVQAWQAPVFHLALDVVMDGALTRSKHTPETTVTDVLIEAVAKALEENPALNAHYDEESITTFTEINIGLAVATPAGLVVPVIHNIAGKEQSEIAEMRKGIVNKARDGKLSMPDIEGATFTISNLGMLGIDSFDAIVNPPQVAILAVGSTQKRPVVINDQIEIKKVATFTLTCDHRALDGATGAKFLTTLKNHLE